MASSIASRCYPAQGIHLDGCRHGIAGRSRSEAQRERRDEERRNRRKAGQQARREREIDTLSPTPDASGAPISGAEAARGPRRANPSKRTDTAIAVTQAVLDKVSIVSPERLTPHAEADRPSRQTECGACGKEFRTPEVADRHHGRSHKRIPRDPEADGMFDVPTEDGYTISGEIPLGPEWGGSWGTLAEARPRHECAPGCRGTPRPPHVCGSACPPSRRPAASATPKVEYHTSTVDPADYWFRNGGPAEPMTAQLSPEGRALADELRALIGPDDMPGGGKVQPPIRVRLAQPVPPPPEKHIGTDALATPCLCNCHPNGQAHAGGECDERECYKLDNPDKPFRAPSPMAGGIWRGFSGKPADFDPHGWDTDEVCNADRWRNGKPLVSRRACHFQEHPAAECRTFFEGRYWTHDKYGPSRFPNRAEGAA